MKKLHTKKNFSNFLEVKDFLKNKLYDMKNNEKIFINGFSYAYVRCLKSMKEIDKKIIQNLNFSNLFFRIIIKIMDNFS